jgi:hypothetical protein
MASWTGKMFDVNGKVAPQRLVAVTLFPNETWHASDPKQMIGEAGTYKYMSGMLQLFDGSKPVLRLDLCEPDSVEIGDYGSGTIDSSAEMIDWRCTKVHSS